MHNSNINKPRDLPKISHHRTMTSQSNIQKYLIPVTDVHKTERYLKDCLDNTKIPEPEKIPRSHPYYERIERLNKSRKDFKSTLEMVRSACTFIIERVEADDTIGEFWMDSPVPMPQIFKSELGQIWDLENELFD